MDLKDDIKWFNSLSEDRKWSFLKYLYRKENYKEVTREEIDKLYDLEDETRYLIDQGKNKSQVLKKLVSLGLNRKTSKKLYDNAVEHSSYRSDARLINLIENELFDEFLSFLFNNYYLIGKYDYDYVSSFSNLDKFNKTEHANRIRSVVQRELLMTLERGYSISDLKYKLSDKFKLDTRKVEIFISKIENNFDELEKAFIIKSLIEVRLKLDSIIKNNEKEDPVEYNEVDKIIENIYKFETENDYKDNKQSLILKYLINMEVRLELFLKDPKKDNSIIF